MSKKNSDIQEYDLTGTDESSKLTDEIEALEKRIFTLEKIILDNELGHLMNKTISDEEYICIKGIDSIKKLAVNKSLTKDDVNMFDVLYRNLNTCRGIKPAKDKKEKKLTVEELRAKIKTV